MFVRVTVPALVIILAPNHTGVCDAEGGVSLWEAGAFRTPLGEVPIDAAFSDALLAASPLVGVDHDAHRGEHAVEVELPFADLSQKVTTLLSADTAGKGLNVKEVKIWGVGDTAVVMVGLEGKVNGALYLLGRVSYDSLTRSVLLSDLRYTLESHDMMTRIKSTFGAGRIKAAIDSATGKGHLAVGEQLDSLKSRLNYELNRSLAPGVRLARTVRHCQTDERA